ncbi:MAG: 3-keto-5-aminohexanoate cleavage protein [Clostridia bacterium]|nr:3-keto-5-aminohexanoate cleavage protein [Clostridia bacterium]
MSELRDYYVEDYLDAEKYISKLSRSGLSQFSPLIISCAITGANQGKEANPNLPETAEEAAQQTFDAYNAGASMVHVHRRSSQNNAVMTKDPNEYRELNAMIRDRCADIIINNTAGGGRTRLPDGSISPLLTVSLDAKPEVASIDISNFVSRAKMKKRLPPLTGRDEDQIVEYSYSIMPTEAEQVMGMMRENGIKPAFECFDIGDLQYLHGFIGAGIAEAPHLVEVVFNNGTCFPTIDYMMTAMKYMPKNTVFSAIATGATQFPLLAAAIILGANVRVGMEDNIYLGKGQLAKSNAELVEKIVRIANELGRPIATPAQAREMLGLGAPRAYQL